MIKDRYTIRVMDGRHYIYDRKKGGITGKNFDKKEEAIRFIQNANANQ